MEKSDFNILGESWAITEEALEGIAAEIMASGHGEPGKDIKLDVRNDIAIVRVTRSLYRYSYDHIRKQVEAAVSDGSVRAIVLKINSPGGLVAGCKELADFLFDAGKKKNIYAYADGNMCSAAYWIGSVAKFIAAPVTASVGSIGVRTLHIDWSGWNEKAGLKFTHLAAGSYKTLGNEDEPLGKEGKEYYQGILDTLYTIFVDSVARNRGVDTDKALSMADGKVFLAGEAKEKGLIDRIEQDFESYFKFILAKEKIMDLTQLKTDHADLYSQVLGIGKKEAEAENKEKIKEAVAKETTRMFGIASSIFSDDEAKKFSTIVESGASVDVVNSLKGHFGLSDEEKAEAEEKASREKILDGLKDVHADGVDLENGKAQTGHKNLEDQAKAFSDLVNN